MILLLLLVYFRLPQVKKYCNGCGMNLTCFVITEHKRMLNEASRVKPKRTFEDRHFFPQSW